MSKKPKVNSDRVDRLIRVTADLARLKFRDYHITSTRCLEHDTLDMLAVQVFMVSKTDDTEAVIFCKEYSGAENAKPQTVN